jgi:hypothetical protein
MSWAQGGTCGVTTRHRINYFIGNILRDRQNPVHILQHQTIHADLFITGADAIAIIRWDCTKASRRW